MSDLSGGSGVSPEMAVTVGLGPDDLRAGMRADVTRGLLATPKELASKYFYDEEGSALFDAITRLPEYYPTRTERSILVATAGEIAERSGADTLIELGSGTSEKTRILLDALHARGALRRFVPFDVDEATLRQAAGAVAGEYPGVAVHAVVGDFERHLGLLPGGGRRMIAFLGSTIGNLTPEQRAVFLTEVRATLEPGDTFLLGTDLVKDTGRLEAAYDDSAGVTAAFNRNLLHRLNRELDADFVPEAFDHVALFDTGREWIEMRLRASADQVVTVAGLGLTVTFSAGEEMRTEISAKFRPDGLAGELTEAGLELLELWTDPDGDFALSLSTPK
ncbi:MAG TPA: L-histidine N(alpha)-methyltransferase [Acidimicrobiia bacterium]|nr:L-histidine N(alpha)-methyltransferase [Acidimicrobiia bacterium]